ERFAVRREDDVAGPVMIGRDVFDDGFRITGRLQVTIAIGKAHDAVAVGDINPLRVLARRVEGDAVGLVEIAGKYAVLRRLRAALGKAIDADLVGFAVGDEQVAIWRGAHDARIVDARRH